jgi:orotate phosphoribosyltransferase
VIFGPAYKGIPFAALVAAELSRSHSVDVQLSFNRKEAKDHGEGGNLVGTTSLVGKRVVIVDDVITAGTAIREAFDIIRGAGGEVVGVVVALDREEKGKHGGQSAVQELRRTEGVPVWAVMRRRDVESWLSLEGRHAELESMTAYSREFGVDDD